MVALALATLRTRVTSFAGALLAVTLGGALVLACGVLLESALRGDRGGDRFAATDLVVTGDRRVLVAHGDETDAELVAGRPPLPADLAERLAAVPGVALAVADRVTPAVVLAASGSPAVDQPSHAHSWDSSALTPYELVAGTAPEQPGTVVLDERTAAAAGVAPGGEVEVQFADGVAPRAVAGIVAAPEAQVEDRVSLFLPAADPAVLAAPVTAVGVVGEAGVPPGLLRERVDEALPAAGFAVLTGADRQRADTPDALVDYAGVVAVLGVLGGVSIVAAAFVVGNTLAFAAQQRAHEFALLRAVGATPGQLRRTVAGEGLIVALAGSAAGLPVGLALAHGLAALLRSLGAAPEQYRVLVGPVPVLVAVASAVAVAQAGALLATRRVLRIGPSQALSVSRVAAPAPGAGAVVLGLLAAGGAVAVLLAAPMAGAVGVGMSFIAVTLLLVSAVLVLPSALAVTGALGRAAAAPLGAVPSLAVASVTRNAERTGRTAGPLVLLLALNATLVLTSQVLTELGARQEADRVQADLVVSGAAPGVPPAVASGLAELPGVEAAALRRAELVVSDGGGLDTVDAWGLPAGAEAAGLDLGVVSGDLAELRREAGRGAEAADRLPVASARSAGRRVGDELAVWLPDGTAREARVVAVFARDLGAGELVLPVTVLREHAPQAWDDLVTVRLESGSPEAGAAAAEAVARAAPAVRVLDRSAYLAAGQAQLVDQQWVLAAIVAVSAGFTVIAVVTTFAMGTTARSRELRGLRLAGATRAQVRDLLRVETAVVVLVGTAAGAVVTSIVVSAYGVAQGLPADPFGDPARYATAVGVTALVGVLGGEVGRWLARTR